MYRNLCPAVTGRVADDRGGRAPIRRSLRHRAIYTPYARPAGSGLGSALPLFPDNRQRGRVSYPHPMRRRWGNRWRRFCGLQAAARSARAKSRNLIVLILFTSSEDKGNGSPSLSPSFLHFNCTFQHYSEACSPYDQRTSFRNQDVFAPGLNNGPFSPPASGGYIKFSPFMFYYG